MWKSEKFHNLEESLTFSINKEVKSLINQGRKIYNLGIGEIVFKPTPQYIQDFLIDKLNQNNYTPIAGLEVLREQIRGNASKFYGLDLDINQIVVVAGGKPGLMLLLMAILKSEDEVILPTPAWVSYKHIISIVGSRVVEVSLTDKFDIDIDAIKSVISEKTRVILINSPNNPTGTIYSQEALKKLAKLIKGKNIFILSDDIYAKITYTNNFLPITNFGFEKLLISNGFSKSQALAGWRIGYIIAPQEIADRIIKLQSHLLGNASIISQLAALAALKEGDKPPMLAYLKKNRKTLLTLINDIPGINIYNVTGAFYYFLDIRFITKDTLGWSRKLLLEHGVAVIPGEAFSAPGFIRISFACDNKTLVKGLQKIKKFIRS